MNSSMNNQQVSNTLDRLRCPVWCGLEPSDHVVEDMATPDSHVAHRAVLASGRAKVELWVQQTATGMQEPEVFVECSPEGMTAAEAAAFAKAVARANALAGALEPLRMADLPSTPVRDVVASLNHEEGCRCQLHDRGCACPSWCEKRLDVDHLMDRWDPKMAHYRHTRALVAGEMIGEAVQLQYLDGQVESFICADLYVDGVLDGYSPEDAAAFGAQLVEAGEMLLAAATVRN